VQDQPFDDRLPISPCEVLLWLVDGWWMAEHQFGGELRISSNERLSLFNLWNTFKLLLVLVSHDSQIVYPWLPTVGYLLRKGHGT
jgi:hypothetical protein